MFTLLQRLQVTDKLVGLLVRRHTVITVSLITKIHSINLLFLLNLHPLVEHFLTKLQSRLLVHDHRSEVAVTLISVLQGAEFCCETLFPLFVLLEDVHHFFLFIIGHEDYHWFSFLYYYMWFLNFCVLLLFYLFGYF